ncbi:MAG: cyclase family protein [Actinobacteria bacterium]|nr:cyclase family protein [Actinomycetota bacterium]
MVHWPGDEDVVIERTQDLERGGPYNLSRAVLSLHSGTHVDAPLHFIPGGRGIDEMPPSATVGQARVIEIRDPVSITPTELEACAIAEGERVLFKTANSGRVWDTDTFVEDFVYLSEAGAMFLAQKGVRAVGIDYLSIGPYGEDASGIHKALLEAGIWIIEGLDLSAVEPGDYELVCLPLKVERGDGAPARAILRSLY